MSEKITAHRALTELKTLAGNKESTGLNRIDKAIMNGIFCAANKKSNNKISGMSIEDYEKKVIISSYDTVIGLIKRYNDLKTALVMSNAGIDFDVISPLDLKKHLIAGENLTVAQIIERKNSIGFEKNLLEKLKLQYRNQVAILNKENDAMPQKVEKYLSSSGFGARDNSNADEIKKVEDQFKENQTYILVDPLNILEKINKLENKITDFEIEADSFLSEINATTFLTVD